MAVLGEHFDRLVPLQGYGDVVWAGGLDATCAGDSPEFQGDASYNEVSIAPVGRVEAYPEGGEAFPFLLLWVPEVPNSGASDFAKPWPHAHPGVENALPQGSWRSFEFGGGKHPVDILCAGA
ncbi:unnamed protein product [Sphagnum jensenii]|uniref:Uncharacterized protein n=1 Tax=Sphagnum jensenii TaxID=128206 RepID=A0ABP0VS69_9BRYO